MKPQKPDSSSKLFVSLLKTGLITTTVLVLILSCKNDLETVTAFSNEVNYPIQTAKNFEVQYTDSGLLQVIFRAPKMERYQDDGNEEGPYYEFSEGLEIYFYNKNQVLESVLTARYGKYWDEEELGFASDSVVAKNEISGEQLNTEELYWNRSNQKIYSGVFTKITNEEGVFYGERGFESDQNFDNYKLLGSSGTVNVEDEEFN